MATGDPMTRTEAILAAIQRRLDLRRREIDAGQDIRSVTFDVKLSPGCVEPRETIDRIERGDKSR